MNKTLELIVRTGYKMFVEKGYNNVTANDICKACGISKTTFYYHLKSKADIFKYAVDVAVDDVEKILLKYYNSVNESQTCWEKIIKFYDTILLEGIMEGTPDSFSQMLIANLETDGEYCHYNKVLASIGIWLIRDAQNAGEIRNNSSAEEIYKAIGFGNMGQQLCWCIKKGSFGRHEQMHRFLEVICDVAPEYKLSAKTQDDTDSLITWYRE